MTMTRIAVTVDEATLAELQGRVPAVGRWSNGLAGGDARLHAALGRAHHLGTEVAVPMIIINETVVEAVRATRPSTLCLPCLGRFESRGRFE